jgi:lactate dehydrogenase-like 2-hydroxyacid dehydrogenase
MPQPVTILRAAPDLPEKTIAELHRTFRVVDFPRGAGPIAAMLAEHGKDIRGIAVRQRRIDAGTIARQPALEIISCYAAGLDGIDLDAAARRGIKVCNTSAVLAEDVADLAIALIIGVTRYTMAAHDYVRDGRWPAGGIFTLGRTLRGMKVGIVGFGYIGEAVARRLAAMRVEVAYHGPRPKPVPLADYPDIVDLATWADMLVLACPLIPETHHLVDGAVLAALGPDGYLVNVGRGPVVDEAALIDALARDALAGAGLDVFETEPDVPEALRRDDRVILAPHMGSGTRETRQGMGDSMFAALADHFSACT